MISRIFSRALRRLDIMKIRPLNFMAALSYSSTTKYHKEANIDKIDEDSIYAMEQQHSSWCNNYEEVVSNFPFYSIPIGIIRNPSKFNMNTEELHNLIAFKALTARSNDVKLAVKILFPKQKDFEQFSDHQGGRALFSLHFESKCLKLINSLNLGQGTLNQRIISLLIFNNMLLNSDLLPNDLVKRIDVRSIARQDETGVLIAYCVQLLLKFGLQYTHLLQLVLTKLEDANNPLQMRLRIARAIITTPSFETYYSRKIIDAAVGVFTISIETMHNFEILFAIRNIYNYNSYQSKCFAETLQKYLIKKHIDENNLDFHIPLILKTIRYCNRLGQSTKELVQFITNNMKRFQIIFDTKRASKGLFFSLLFSSTNRDISPELVGHLKTYFLDNLQHFIGSEQTEEGELLRFNKLLVKYFEHFTEKEQEYIRNQYIEKLIPYYSSSNQVLFYSLLVYLRAKIPQQQINDKKNEEVLRKYILIFIERSCKKSNAEEQIVIHNINSVIEMMYQILRHNLTFTKHQLPLICKYDFAQKDSINPETLNYFFYYLVKTQHESKQAVKQALTSVLPLIQTYIRKHRLTSMKTIFMIIDVCHKVNFEHNFFFKILENSIAQFLIKNPKYVIIENDLKFINEKLLKRGYGSPKLKQMVLGTLDKPRNWQSLRNEYTENEKKFLESLDRKRRQKQYQQKY